MEAGMSETEDEKKVGSLENRTGFFSNAWNFTRKNILPVFLFLASSALIIFALMFLLTHVASISLFSWTAILVVSLAVVVECMIGVACFFLFKNESQAQNFFSENKSSTMFSSRTELNRSFSDSDSDKDVDKNFSIDMATEGNGLNGASSTLLDKKFISFSEKEISDEAKLDKEISDEANESRKNSSEGLFGLKNSFFNSSNIANSDNPDPESVSSVLSSSH